MFLNYKLFCFVIKKNMLPSILLVVHVCAWTHQTPIERSANQVAAHAAADERAQRMTDDIFAAIKADDDRLLNRLLKVEHEDDATGRQLTADLSTEDEYGVTAMHYAAGARRGTMVELLMENGAPIEVELGPKAGHREGETPIFFAVAAGNRQSLDAFLGAGVDLFQVTKGGMTLGHFAAGLGRIDELRVLAEHDVSMQARTKDAYESTLLHLAATSGPSAASVQTLEYLIEQHNLAVNEQNKKGATALHGACAVGDVAAVKLLLSHGADPALRNSGGKLAIDVARAQAQRRLQRRLSYHEHDGDHHAHSHGDGIHAVERPIDLHLLEQLLVVGGAPLKVRQDEL